MPRDQSSPIGSPATLTIGAIGVLFMMANSLIPALQPSVQPWGQLAVRPLVVRSLRPCPAPLRPSLRAPPPPRRPRVLTAEPVVPSVRPSRHPPPAARRPRRCTAVPWRGSSRSCT
jgi:hypothetical protein